MAEPVCRKQQPAGHQQRKADEKRVFIKGRDLFSKEHEQHQRQRRKQDEQDHPLPERIGLLPAARFFEMELHKPLARQTRNVAPICDQHRTQCSEMQQHIKKEVIFR